MPDGSTCSPAAAWPAITGQRNPARLARYCAASASRSRRTGVSTCPARESVEATPQDTPVLMGRPSTRRHTSSATRTASLLGTPVTTMQNSSPPIRAARLPATRPLAWLTAWPTAAIRRSPASWPNESLTCLSRLMSASTTEIGKVRSLPGAISVSSRSSTARRLASPVSGSWKASRSMRAKWSACTTPVATWVATAAANSRSARLNRG